MSTAVIRETLRLNPPASFRTVSPHEDAVIGGGKYFVEKDISIVINTWKMQRDPKIWGEDVGVMPFFSLTFPRLTRIRLLSSNQRGC